MAQAGAVSWQPNADGQWSTASNWSSNPALPGASDDVTIDVGGATVRTITHASGSDTIASLTSNENLVLSGGTLTLAGASSTNAGFTFGAGTLSGGGTLTVKGTLAWSGGAMTGTGSTAIASGATANLSATSSLLNLSRELDNAGTLNLSPATNPFNVYNNLNNLAGGTFNLSGDGITVGAGTGGTITNGGTLNRTGTAAGTSYINTPFNNTGTVDIQNGTLQLAGGGTSTGNINVRAGTTLTFSQSYTLGAGATLTGTGNVALGNSPTLNINTDLSIFHLTQTGGTLAGTGNTTITNTLDWTGGSTSSQGKTTIAAGAVANLSPTSSMIALNRPLDNAGTINLSLATNVFNVYNTLSNLAGGTFNLNGDGATVGGGAGGTFTNAGTINRTGTATGIGYINTPFNNAGTVDIQNGTLLLAGGGTSTANINVRAGSTLTFSLSYTFGAGATLTGTGNVALGNGPALNINTDLSIYHLTQTGGSLAGTGNTTITNTLDWTGGSTSSQGKTTISAGATATLSATSSMIALNRPLDNAGTVNLSPAANVFNVYNTLNNLAGGTFSLNGDGATVGGGAGGTFTNSGTINRTGTATGIGYINTPFNNTGAVDIQNGTLQLAAGGTSTGNINVRAGATLNFSLSYTFGAGATLTGTGNVALGSGPTLNVNTDLSIYHLTQTGGSQGGTGNTTITGTLDWTGGSTESQGKTTIAAGATANLSATSRSMSLSRQFDNGGTVNFSAAANTFYVYNNLNNLAGGTFNLNGDGATISAGVGGVFNNSGTINRTGTNTGTGYINTPLNNTGTVDVQNGTLRLPGAITQVNGTTLTGGTWSVRNGATLDLPNISSLTANQAIVLLDGATSTFARINSITSNSGSFTITNGRNFTTAGTFTNTGTLVVGSGSTFTKLAGSAYSQTAGTTTLQNGALTASAGVSFTGGSLTGSGTINGAVTIGSPATLSPGASIGTLTVSSTLGLGGTSAFEISPDPVPSSDKVQGISTLTYGGTLRVTALGNSANFAAGQVYDLFDFAGYGGTFSSISLPALPQGLQWKQFGGQQFDYGTGSIQIEYSVQPTHYAMNVSARGVHDVLLNGRVGLTSTITNTGSAHMDALDFTGLGASSTAGGTVSGPASGDANVALGDQRINAGQVFRGTAYNSAVALTPAAAARNHMLQTAAIADDAPLPLLLNVGLASAGSGASRSTFGQVLVGQGAITGGGRDYSGLASRTLPGAGALGTEAIIREGLDATGDHTVHMSWRQRYDGTVGGVSGSNLPETTLLFSDVVRIEGMDTGSSTWPDERRRSDVYVLQMSYVDASDSAGKPHWLAYLDLGSDHVLGGIGPAADHWVAAPYGNLAGDTGTLTHQSWDDYRSGHSGNLGDLVGNWGWTGDGNGTGTVWAVINYDNAQFAVVPLPPAVWAALPALGMVGMIQFRRRRR